MGWAKKTWKSAKKAVKKAVKSVTKFVKKVVDVVVSALKKVWDKVIMPILDAIMEFLGIKDEDVTMVAANTQPLFTEDMAFLTKDDVFLRASMHSTDFVEAIKEVILDGRHNDYRGYYRYGKDGYTRGLPTVEYGGAVATVGYDAIMDLWNEHVGIHNLPKDLLKYEDLPLSFSEFELAQNTPRELVTTDILKSYALTKDRNIYFDGSYNWEIDWLSLVTETTITVMPENPDEENPEGNTEYLVDSSRLNQYFQSTKPTLTYRFEEVEVPPEPPVEGEEPPLVPPEPVYETVRVTTLHFEHHPELIYTFDSVVRESGSSVDLAPDSGGMPITVTGKAVFGTINEWTLGHDETSNAYDLVATGEVTDPLFKPDLRVLSGVIENSLHEFSRFTFTVNNPRYTPYPEDLDHVFRYIREKKDVDDNFTGAGADTDVDLIYGIDYGDAVPIVVLKNESVWIDSNKSSQDYITSKKLLKYMTMDIDSLLSTIKDNESAGDVTTAAIRFGTDILSENQACRLYSYNFFKFFYKNQVISKADWDSALVGSTITRPQDGGVVTIPVSGKETFNQYVIKEGSFNSTISMNYIDRYRKTITPAEAKKKGFIELSTTDEDVTFTKHLGNNQVEVIFVKKLIGSYVIKPLESKKAEVAMMTHSKSDNVDVQSGFIIPLIRGVMKTITPLQLEEVRARSAYLTVFSGTYEKIRWYKTAKFLKIIVTVIAIVVFILTLPAGGSPGVALYATLTAALTFAGLKALVIKLVVAYAVTRIAAYAIERALLALGADEWAAVVALIAATAAAYYGGNALGGDVSWSTALLKSAQAVGQAFGKIQMDTLKDLNSDMTKFMDDFELQSEENQQLLKELEMPLQAKLRQYIAESPELFFGRTEADTTEALLMGDAETSVDLDHIFI